MSSANQSCAALVSSTEAMFTIVDLLCESTMRVNVSLGPKWCNGNVTNRTRELQFHFPCRCRSPSYHPMVSLGHSGDGCLSKPNRLRSQRRGDGLYRCPVSTGPPRDHTCSRWPKTGPLAPPIPPIINHSRPKAKVIAALLTTNFLTTTTGPKTSSLQRSSWVSTPSITVGG